MAESSTVANEQTPVADPKEKVIHIKLVLLGESAVGKSSLALRFCHNDFSEITEPTIGSAFLTQKIKVGEKTIKYEIWDTAGQERFSSLAPMYYRNAQASIVVYDVTKPSSFQKAKHWVNELNQQASANVVIALAGNKIDLVESATGAEDVPEQTEATIEESTQEVESSPKSQASNEDTQTSASAPASLRQVTFEEASKYAQDHGLIHYEISAKTNYNVTELFTEIAQKLPFDSLFQARNQRAFSLNSGNGRLDLLREGGGASAFGNLNQEGNSPFRSNNNGCC